MTNLVEPTQEQLAEIMALAGTDADGPIVMLNLNRYRDRGEYLKYAAVAERVLAEVGGSVMWHADALATVIGDETDRWHEVIAVRYPSRRAFVALATHPDCLAAREHRVGGLERAALVCCADD